MSIHIRDETDQDIVAIQSITKAAFLHHEHSVQTEHLIIAALRDAGALSVSLVAEEEGRVIGHIAFSAVSISDGSIDWYGLGPVSVHPLCQKRGVGKALIVEGLKRIQALGAKGCVLVGDSEYYQRFGFISIPNLTYDNVPQEYVLALGFGHGMPRGQIKFHEGFAAGQNKAGEE